MAPMGTVQSRHVVSHVVGSWDKLPVSYRRHSRVRCPSRTWSPCRTVGQWHRRWRPVVSSSDARRRCYTHRGRAPSRRRSSRARVRIRTWCSDRPSDDRTELVVWLPLGLVDKMPGTSPTYKTPLPQYKTHESCAVYTVQIDWQVQY